MQHVGDGMYTPLSQMMYVRLYKYELKTKLSHKKSSAPLRQPVSKVKVMFLHGAKPDRVE